MAISALEPLLACPSIRNLDLSQNKIDSAPSQDHDEEEEEDMWGLLEIFAAMPELRTLFVQANPITDKLPRLRKNFVSRLKRLTFLNDRPVSEEERLCAEVMIPLTPPDWQGPPLPQLLADRCGVNRHGVAGVSRPKKTRGGGS